jgi:polyisoprenoid-binding protein YceI
VARFKIIGARSRFWFDARSSLHPIKAETAAINGFIEAETDGVGLNLASPPQARIEIDAATVRTGNGLYDRELERRLEVRNYPRIIGEVLEVSQVNPGSRYRVRGNVSLHGVTRMMEGEVTLRAVDDAHFEFEGEKTFDMRDFGLTPPRILMLKVYPEVKVRGRIVAEKQT